MACTGCFDLCLVVAFYAEGTQVEKSIEMDDAEVRKTPLDQII